MGSDRGEFRAAAGRPRRLLFLADCHLRDALWPPFHRNTIRALSAAFDVLAVRTNLFFHDRSHTPRSGADLARFGRAVQEFRPDVVFSINRAGVPPQIHEWTGATPLVVTLFIDHVDRLDPAVHRYRPSEYVWILSNETLRRDFRQRYGQQLPDDHVVATHWCADHHAFFPDGRPRTRDVVYIGTPFGSLPFAEVVNSLLPDPANRAALLAVYEDHKRSFVHDWPTALREKGFAIDRVAPATVGWFRSGGYLQTAASDQLTAEVRFRFLGALAGLDLHIYGTPTLKWLQNIGMVNSDLYRHFQFRGVDDPAELAALYNSARIGVNLQHDSARGHGMSFRVYEIMACQALLVTQADATEPLGQMGFVEGTDFIDFREPAELRRKCEYYLAHDAEREQIAKSAFAKLMSGHTIAHRLADLFGRCGDDQARDAFLASAAGGCGTLGRVRNLPEQPSDMPKDKVELPTEVERLRAEIDALRSSWPLRIGNFLTGPMRPIRRLIRRAG